MARQRNYAKEYADRKARSERNYGVSYGKQRGMVERGKERGLTPEKVRETLSIKKDEPPSDVDSLTAYLLNMGEYDPPDDFDVAEFWAMYSKR